MPVPVAFRYRAFVSYSHTDTSWARWLHSRLEGFRIDKDLLGRETSTGPVPQSLRPIFRDREDFAAGHALTEATIAALDQSAALIVLCSTIAAGRPAVNEEVRLFRSRQPDRPVIPVIVDGTYPDNFPPGVALLRVGASLWRMTCGHGGPPSCDLVRLEHSRCGGLMATKKLECVEGMNGV
jgi:hypothetical protein